MGTAKKLRGRPKTGMASARGDERAREGIGEIASLSRGGSLGARAESRIYPGTESPSIIRIDSNTINHPLFRSGDGVLMKLSVIGIGRVGLPLALAFASKGAQVTGMDVNEPYLQKLREKRMPFFEAGAQELLEKHMGSGFSVTSSIGEAMESDAVILTLGTPVDEFMNPDYSQIDSVLGGMVPHLHPGQVIILRSTVSPGTIEYVKDFIEARSKLAVGRDLFLAFCPERLAEGKAIEELFALPEIVGALDDESAKRAKAVFELIKPEIYVTSATNAELLKLFTNMYRYINFAIANEFMIIAEQFGADIYEIVELANRNYPRGGPKKPGFAAGPCLFKDGFFLTSKIPFPELIAASWKINETLPAYFVEHVKAIAPIKGKKVAVLGLAFKANSDDTRASLSYKLIKQLKRERAIVSVHDSNVKSDVPLEQVLSGAEVLFIATAHDDYAKRGLEYYKGLLAPGCVIVDVWNVLGKDRIVFKV